MWELRWPEKNQVGITVCGPDIRSHRQAYCIPHIGAQGGEVEEQGQEREVETVRKNRKNAGEHTLNEPLLSFLCCRLDLNLFFFPLLLLISLLFCPSCCFLSSLFSISPLSLLHQPAVVTVFLSAVCSAWHSVWRMMAIPEGGWVGVQRVSPLSPLPFPGPSSLHSLYIMTMRPAQHRREREGVLNLPP